MSLKWSPAWTSDYEIKNLDIFDFINQLVEWDIQTKNNAVWHFFEYRKDSMKDKSSAISPKWLLNSMMLAYHDFISLIKSEDDSKYERTRRLSNDPSRWISLWVDIRDILEKNLPQDFWIAFVSLDLIRLRGGDWDIIDKNKLMTAMSGNSKRQDYVTEIKNVFESWYLDNAINTINKLNTEKEVNK